MISTSLQFDKHSQSHLASSMQRFQDEFGKTAEDTIKWTGYKVAQSLSAATKQSPKLRKIVKNPDPRAGKDRRVALFGVNRYRSNRSSFFVPIYRTGEYGNVRFISKTTGEVLSRNSSTGEVHRVQFSLKEFEEAEGSTIKNSPKRKIGRRGLAKKSWTGIRNRINSGGTVSVSQMQANNIGDVTHKRSEGAFELRLRNKLRYAQDAMIPGKVEYVLLAAADSMEHLMDRRAKRSLAKAGLN